jgi:Metal-dependent proteases with possible chaperone activity
MTSLAEEMGIDLYLPDLKHTTDNALMIAVTALMKIENGLLPNNLQEIKADGNLSLV